MTYQADAWILKAGNGEKPPRPAELERKTITIDTLGDDEVLGEPLYGCWEANMTHSLQRTPIDICIYRKEDEVVIGNAGVIKVLEIGKDVNCVKPGQHALIFCNGEEDWFGYPVKILGYDARDAMGCLSTRMKLRQRQLLPIPENTRYSLQQWAAFSLRYITAWSNWTVAHGTYRLQVSWDQHAAINVWGWGGGVTFAELDLARRHGCRAAMLSGNDQRLAKISERGLIAIDRREFGDLTYEPKRYRSDPEYREHYRRAEAALVEKVRTMTKGRMVQIFVDYIGEPVFRATLASLARQGVITTAGWKEGMSLSTLRAVECINRHQHIHTHYASWPQAWAAVAFAEANGWLPDVGSKVYSFDQIPELARDYEEGRTEMFPIFSINPE